MAQVSPVGPSLCHVTTPPPVADLEEAAVSLCCCLEVLVEASKTFHEESLQWHSLMRDYLVLEHSSAVEVSLELQQTLCQQTALYCTKMLKVGVASWWC